MSPAAHLVRGTFQPSRHAGHDVPESPGGVPESPKKLSGDAAKEWDRMIGRLQAMGSLSRVDDAALYQYCRLFAETEELFVTKGETAASIDILEENIGDLHDADLVAAFQEITKLRMLEARYGVQIRQGRMSIRQYLVEFGLTPSARSRVKLPAAKAKVDPNKAKYGVTAG